MTDATETIVLAARTDSVAIEERRYNVSRCSHAHAHDTHSIVLVTRGRVREELRRTERRCGPGQTSFIPLGEWHRTTFTHGARCVVVMPAVNGITIDAGLWLHAMHAGSERRHRPAFLLRAIQQELRLADEMTGTMIDGLFLQLVATVEREARNQRRHEEPPAWLRDVRAAIDDGFRSRIDLRALAAAQGVHPVTLTREFTRYFRVPPTQYVLSCRTEWASRALRTSTLPISEIALSAGFSDAAHFSNRFRRMMGTTPSAYRKLAGKE